MALYDFVVKFTMSVGAKLNDGVAAEVSQRLGSFFDGRYHFHTEMVHEGLIRTLDWVIDRCGQVHVAKAGRVLAVVECQEQAEALKGKWRGLCRLDRLPDGRPGPYGMSSNLFATADAARDWVCGVSLSRHPLIVEAEKAAVVMAVLNA